MPSPAVPDAVEALARSMHEAYLAVARRRGETVSTNPSVRAWEQLPETLRRANLDQARQIAEKVRVVGAHVVARSRDDGAPFAFTDHEVERLARLEHERWCADRRRDGWVLAPGEKDLDARATPHLVPWEQLDEHVRELDRVMVRGIPAFLAEAGLRVVREPGVATSEAHDPKEDAMTTGTKTELPLLDWIEHHLPRGPRDLVHLVHVPLDGFVAWALPYARTVGSMTRMQSTLTAHRQTMNDAAIVFVHGFAVNPEVTWGDFPELLMADPALEGWDVFSLGYNTHVAPDVRGVWASDPSIVTLAGLLRSRAKTDPLRRYSSLALIGHSMGGLIVQRALCDDPAFALRVSHVFVFGTPSTGVAKASLGRLLKTQMRDFSKDSDFIVTLRKDWDERFGRRRPFEFWSVAGDRDNLVPRSSSLDPFPSEQQVVVPGNHLECVYAKDSAMMSVRVVVDGLTGQAAPGGPWNSARVAVQHRDFHRAITLLSPHAAELDDAHVVELALALDAVGDRAEALRVLREHGSTSTDVTGTLAGRYKRAWMAEGRRDDGEQALGLYQEAFVTATASGDHEQACYNGINLAFMTLAFRRDRKGAAEIARQVLESAEHAPPDQWLAATAGEAHLYLAEVDEALASYRAAVEAHPAPRELETVYAQAYRVAGLLEDGGLQRELDRIFRAGVPLPAA